MTTRGIRNNNPGNIRKSKDPWQGLAEEQLDTDFFSFSSAVMGIRALARILITYQDDYNMNSVRSIISRWAPNTENKTQDYIDAVAKEMEVSPGDILDVHHYEDLMPLVVAIIRHENGSQPYSQAVIDKALLMAGVEKEPPHTATSRQVVVSTAAIGATGLGGVADFIDQNKSSLDTLQYFAQYTPIVIGSAVVIISIYFIFEKFSNAKRGA